MAEITEAQLKEALEKQKQELQAEFEKQTEGLRSNRDSLLAEKKQIEESTKQQILEKEQAAIEAAQKAGDIEKQFELERAQLERKQAEMSEQLNQRNDLILSSKKEASVNSIVSNFAKQDKLSQLTASQLVEHGFDEGGNVITSYKDLNGNVVADNQDDWLSWAKNDPDMSNHLVGTQASGTDYSTVKPSVKADGADLDRQARIEEINSKFS
mgnify:CR=1 FL=1